MKKLMLSFGVVLMAILGLNTVNAQIEKGAKIEFNKEVHDYGNIKYGGEPNCAFEFKNTGNEPLIISNAKGSCGCTVPSKPQKPIQPGETSQITAEVNTANLTSKQIIKSVTTMSNTEPNIHILEIKAKIK